MPAVPSWRKTVMDNSVPNDNSVGSKQAGVFIVGSPRSGTTLLQSILASHSEYFSAPETSFFSRIIPSLGIAYSNPTHSITKCDARAIEADFKLMTGIDIEIASSLSSEQQIRRTFEKVLQCFNANEKKNWIEKTTLHAISMLAIRRFYANAKFIHIIRDPVDAVSSMVNMRPTSVSDSRIGYISSYRAQANLWKLCVLSALQYPDQENVIHIFYEDLVLHPDTELKRICDFLNVSVEPGMLESFHQTAQNLLSEEHCPWQKQNLRPGIAPDAVHKWRRKTSQYNIWLIQLYTKSLSKYLGYYEDTKTNSKALKLIFYVTDQIRWTVVLSGIESKIRKVLGAFGA